MIMATVFFTSQSWAADCDLTHQGTDLGICDTIYVETFNCDHTYEATGAYDSVRLAIYVTHDSNTFDAWPGTPEEKWVQDSIASFVVPLNFTLVGCADSLIFPTTPPYPTSGPFAYWNNKSMDPAAANRFPRSVFRHLVNTHVDPPETSFNRLADMHAAGFPDWTANFDVVNKAPGHFFMNVTPMASDCERWWEGSRVLLGTMTFLLYGLHTPGCDSSAICVDSTLWGTSSHLMFVRYDSKGYCPRHFLPVCDTEYIVPCLPPNISWIGPGESQTKNGTYTTTGTFNATAGGSPGILLTGVAAATAAPGLAAPTVTYTSPLPPQATLTGTVTYTVTNHCLAGGAITLTATNNCAPPLTAQTSFNVSLSNVPPAITMPANASVTYAAGYSGTATATDANDDVLAFSLVSGPAGVQVLANGNITWNTDCPDVGGPYTVTVAVTETVSTCGLADTGSFTITVTNGDPEITHCPINMEKYWSLGDLALQSENFTVTDPEGQIKSVTVTAATWNPPTIVGSHVEWMPTVAELDIPFTMTLTVTDSCGLTDECTFTMKAKKITGWQNAVIIPNVVYERFGYKHWVYPDTGIYMDDACEPYNGVNPGDFFEIPIIVQNFPDSIAFGGFELEVEYDYIDLTFYGAEPGRLLSQRWYTESETPNPADSIFWSWEYFSYRVLPCPLCACCKYKILLYGQAEMPDGLFRLGYCLQNKTPQPKGTYWGEDYAWYKHKVGQPEHVKVGATLAWLKFQVANNELLRDLKLPVVFEWEHKLSDQYPYHIIQDWDCQENTFSDCGGTKLYVSGDLMQYDPTICPALPVDQRIFNFIDGGVHICSPCTAFTCVRGDINMDGNAYSTADAVMFARALIYGAENVFTINLAKQKCATDANADGRTMMLSDLIYLIRIIQHDATEFPKLGPSSDIANVVVSDGRIAVECASPIGGLLFEFDGAVTPTLLNTNMELLSKDGKVLVWSSDGNSINAGSSEILSANGAKLVSVMAVDRDGRDLATTITTKVAPSAFALHPAYPNPFNPYTNLSFSLPNAVPYSMNIYNVAGQLVRSYEGMGNVGLNVITWDGKDNLGSAVSSGVYFYKLSAGSFTATNKMVMMK
jgi:hypothetical protein